MNHSVYYILGYGNYELNIINWNNIIYNTYDLYLSRRRISIKVHFAEYIILFISIIIITLLY